jgi:uncharacterized protein YgbK (DUF1537 family)
MTTLRLIADDLSGALDTAAAFVPITGEVDCVWHGPLGASLPPNVAIDAATRECRVAEAVARHRVLAPLLAGADIAFKKLDSLLRGHAFAEMAALFASGAWTHLVLAPAFPFQGRITRDGRQYRLDADGCWQKIGPDLAAAIEAVGIPARRGGLDAPLLPGATLFDAEADSDLVEIVRLGHACGGRVLWCGTAGLAQALAGPACWTSAALGGPVLGLFGSDQAVTAGQLAKCAPYVFEITGNDAAPIAARLQRDGVAMAGFALPANTPRDDAARRISDRLAVLLPQLDRPGSLIVAGGETLRAICDILGATSLRVTGAIMPGVPCSTMQGGAWDGVDVISKSGAFGAPPLLRDLLRGADIAFERTGS